MTARNIPFVNLKGLIVVKTNVYIEGNVNNVRKYHIRTNA